MFGFFHEKFQKFLKMYLSVQVNESLGRLIFRTLLQTDVSNHLSNFPMCVECKEEQKHIYIACVCVCVCLCSVCVLYKETKN